MNTRLSSSRHERVIHVERARPEAIGDPRFLSHLVLHEIEAWVLLGHEALGKLTGDPKIAHAVQEIVANAQGAELVNDGADTAPLQTAPAPLPALPQDL